MKCEICNKNNAETVFFRQLEDGSEEELYVCKACASRERAFQQAHGIQVATMEAPPLPPELQGLQPPPFMGQPPISPEELMRKLEELPEDVLDNFPFPGKPNENAPRCPNCGKTFFDIEHGDGAGCANCYTLFRKEMEEYFETMQQCTRYPGPPPAWIADKIALNNLEKAYQTAILEDDLELAAKLDKEMRDLKNKLAHPDDEQERDHEA